MTTTPVTAGRLGHCIDGLHGLIFVLGATAVDCHALTARRGCRDLVPALVHGSLSKVALLGDM